MTIEFSDVLITVVSLFLLAVPGFLLVKYNVIKKEACDPLSALVLYGFQPLLMFVGFQKVGFDSEIAVNMLIVAGLTAFIHLAMIGLVFLIIKRVKGKDEATVNCIRFASVFANCGYMGFPFLQALFSSTPYYGEMLIYGSVVVAVFNVLTWSIGIYMISGNKKDMSLRRAVWNPTVVAVIIGLLVFFTVKTPLVDIMEEGSFLDKVFTKLMASADILANAVTPVSMIVIGMRLSSMDLKKMFLDKSAYLSSAMKLVVMCLLTMFTVAFLPVSSVIKYVLYLLLSMPSATATVMFAVRFGGDADTSSVCVLLSTVLSIITVPLSFLFFSGVLGVVI